MSTLYKSKKYRDRRLRSRKVSKTFQSPLQNKDAITSESKINLLLQ